MSFCLSGEAALSQKAIPREGCSKKSDSKSLNDAGGSGRHGRVLPKHLMMIVSYCFYDFFASFDHLELFSFIF